jgi:hypothetical protein
MVLCGEVVDNNDRAATSAPVTREAKDVRPIMPGEVLQARRTA